MGTYVSGTQLAAAVLATGKVVVAWTGREGERFVVRAADVGRRLRHIRTVSDPGSDAVLAGLAAGPRGDVALTWMTGIHGADPVPGAAITVIAAVRAAAVTAFGAPERVSAQGANVIPTALVPVAFDSATGRAVAAWIADTMDIAVRAPVAR